MQPVQGGSLVGNAKAVGSLKDGTWLVMRSLVNLGHSMRMCVRADDLFPSWRNLLIMTRDVVIP